MNAPSPPSLPSRRDRRRPQGAEPIIAETLYTRTLRDRLRRQQRIERRFAWLFAAMVTLTTAYLFVRSPWADILRFIR